MLCGELLFDSPKGEMATLVVDTSRRQSCCVRQISERSESGLMELCHTLHSLSRCCWLAAVGCCVSVSRYERSALLLHFSLLNAHNTTSQLSYLG